MERGEAGLDDGVVAVVELGVAGSAAGSDEDEQAPPTRAPSARATRSSEGRARVVTGPSWAPIVRKVCVGRPRGDDGRVQGSFDVGDVLGARPGWWVLVRRGLRRRCPRCGGGDVFVHRYRLAERCPSCGVRFLREPGFFLGAWFINFMVLETLHWLLVMAFIVWRSADPDAGLLLPLAVGVITAVVVPIAFYPCSLTVWAGIDLAMTPLELEEIVDAADAVAEDHPG